MKNKNNQKPKHIIISGANQGIGYYLVKALIESGNNVSVLDKEIDNIKQLQDNCNNLSAFLCDVCDEGQVKTSIDNAVKKYGKINIAIHNACLCTFDSMEKSTDETYKKVYEVNFLGAVHIARNVAPIMAEHGGGKIIFTSSGVGVMGFKDISPYACSKGAIETLAKCMNLEYLNKNVTFQLFHPPLTKTKSASPLKVPKEVLADPVAVGYGLAKNINKKGFCICHSNIQKIQMNLTYLFSVPMGKFLCEKLESL